MRHTSYLLILAALLAFPTVSAAQHADIDVPPRHNQPTPPLETRTSGCTAHTSFETATDTLVRITGSWNTEVTNPRAEFIGQLRVVKAQATEAERTDEPAICVQSRRVHKPGLPSLTIGGSCTVLAKAGQRYDVWLGATTLNRAPIGRCESGYVAVEKGVGGGVLGSVYAGSSGYTKIEPMSPLTVRVHGSVLGVTATQNGWLRVVSYLNNDDENLTVDTRRVVPPTRSPFVPYSYIARLPQGQITKIRVDPSSGQLSLKSASLIATSIEAFPLED